MNSDPDMHPPEPRPPAGDEPVPSAASPNGLSREEGPAGLPGSFRLWFWLWALAAGLAGAAVLWFFLHAWIPAIEGALGRLPDQAAIRRGHLEWSGPEPIVLAENRWLTLEANPRGAPPASSVADVRIELREAELRIHSWLGYWGMPYPQEHVLGLDRIPLQSHWGAWRPAILLLVGLGVIASIQLVWLVLSLLIWAPLHILAGMLRRGLSSRDTFRLALGGWLPAALWLAIVFLLYGLNRLGFEVFLLALVLHAAVAPAAAAVMLALLPRGAGADLSAPAARRPDNPFAPGPDAAEEEGSNPDPPRAQ
ncbi:MAG TPA: hypothetical protein P5555_01975 [Candidatus Paceibacterota bacterium]|nr:hypothetical protein [Verrucomicrobiota bacterium]HRZ43940.1 hypothetical protein [Candidatus Paceibacterota bacterium]